MFHVGQMIIYGALGVCEIMKIETQTLCDTTDEFYILRELDHDAAYATYVPVHNVFLTSQMHPLLTKDEVMSLVRETPDIPEMDWVSDHHARGKLFREVIKSGDRRALISLIKSVLQNEKMRDAAGKKVFINDENAMHHAQKNLYNEFSVVLGVPVEEIPQMLSFPIPG